MIMEKMEKNSNIERLLQAVEMPELFDNAELEAVMEGEETKELYSLLSDIETVGAIDNAPLPDVNTEWSNFARWMRKHRTIRTTGRLRKMHNLHAYISVAAVILFALFIATPLMFIDSQGDAASTVVASEEVVIGSNVTDVQMADDSGALDNGIYIDYTITPAHGYTLPESCFDFDFAGKSVLGLSSGSLEYLFDNFGVFNEFKPFIMDIGKFAPKGCTQIEVFPARFVEW